MARKTVSGPTELELKAEAVTAEIVQLARMAELCFIDMGRLFKQVNDEILWGVYKFDTFQQWCDSLDLPQKQQYKWILGVISIWEVLVLGQGIDKERLARIGIAKCLRLVPIARKGELTELILALAEEPNTTDIHLRDALGHNLGGDDEPFYCPRCGVQIAGVKRVLVTEEQKLTQARYEGDGKEVEDAVPAGG